MPAGRAGQGSHRPSRRRGQLAAQPGCGGTWSSVSSGFILMPGVITEPSKRIPQYLKTDSWRKAWRFGTLPNMDR